MMVLEGYGILKFARMCANGRISGLGEICQTRDVEEGKNISFFEYKVKVGGIQHVIHV